MTGTRSGPRRILARMRGHEWSPPQRAVFIAAVTIVMGSLFLTTYTLALGDPVPHRIDAALVGDPTQHARTVEAVQAGRGGQPQLPAVRVGGGRASRDGRASSVYAALDLTSARPTLYVASAAGASVARVLERISASDPEVRVVDTHPLAPADPNGVDIFYLMLVTTIVGFLTVFQVRANAGGLRLHHWTAWVAGFSLTAALVLTLVVGPVLDRFHVPLAETWGILALHLLAVTSFASLMTVLLGPVGDPPGLAVLRRARQQLVRRRRLAAAAARAVRVHLAMAAVGRHRDGAARRDLLRRLPARPAHPGRWRPGRRCCSPRCSPSPTAADEPRRRGEPDGLAMRAWPEHLKQTTHERITWNSTPETAPVGFIGLGHMGGNMAARFLDTGYEVHGTSRSRESGAMARGPRPALGSTRRARSRRPPTSPSPRSPTTTRSSPWRRGLTASWPAWAPASCGRS